MLAGKVPKLEISHLNFERLSVDMPKKILKSRYFRDKTFLLELESQRKINGSLVRITNEM